MTGLSEYQRNFLWKKSYLSESYNPSVGQKYSWAGLRSDQLGITKEPGFISKRRVPYHDPQISKYLEWNGTVRKKDTLVPPEPQAFGTPKPQEAEQGEDANQEAVLSLEASRVPKRTRSHSADSRAEGVSDTVEKHQGVTRSHAPVSADVELRPSSKQPLSQSIDPRLDRHLRKKAGLAVVPTNNALRNSEYQRQFVWKTSKESAPVFASNQVFRNKSQIIPQFQGNTFTHETEYKRNFKGLTPVKEPKSREYLKGNSSLEMLTPVKKADEPLDLEVDMASEDSDQSVKKPASWRHQRLGKVNSEYRAKFLSPAQYFYKAGAWTRVKENLSNQGSLNAMWYAEVKELREKAESYRKRVQGTHFSRDHLNQIMSDSNCCWDVSSVTSSEGTVSSNIRALDLAGDLTNHRTPQKHPPTKLEERKVASGEQPLKNSTRRLEMPEPAASVRRKLAWDAEESTKEDTQEEPRAEEDGREERGQDKQTCAVELEKPDTQTPKADRLTEGSETSSVSSGKGGRLPTPRLRELGIQRTHHDLTTPAVGGAVLVSPSKVKPPGLEQRRRASSQDGLETLKKDITKKGKPRPMSLLTSPAAGMKTVDPLPLREDCEANVLRFADTLPVSKILDRQPSTPGQLPPCAPPYCHPSSRIQGRLRDPEFQHNMGKPRTNNLQLHPHDAFNDEDADRLSEISARSAVSSLRAFQTLARAQKRKENFWGKP
ncbi:nuclear protein MDM1 isoform X1 [Mus musculus]|uniref:nuclear protein MDM1 isoform X1 n=1 Tax=Mus musculus TaxID=10090 RepID=UPI0003D6E99A|nr:nuclear protein MDM1 isoform X1 [Mus musculus]|eukprot:XP_006513368.1 PREDICTED: nuclear protein MDM1 isoform X1 [Mus musculus]